MMLHCKKREKVQKRKRGNRGRRKKGKKRKRRKRRRKTPGLPQRGWWFSDILPTAFVSTSSPEPIACTAVIQPQGVETVPASVDIHATLQLSLRLLHTSTY